MRKYTHITNIGKMKVNNISHGASVNYGPVILTGFQANVKLQSNQIAIGDEFSFGGSSSSNGENGENANNNSE